jgi:hypothetical protein
MKSVPLASFNERDFAVRLCQQLERTGVAAVIHDESKLERFWFMSEPLAAFHVEVSQPDFLAARQRVQEWERSSDIMQRAVRCPECNSFRVEFPQIPRKFLSPVVMGVLMLLKILPREYYCIDCHFTWPKEKLLEPECDVLGWPLNSQLWHPERTQKPYGRPEAQVMSERAARSPDGGVTPS